MALAEYTVRRAGQVQLIYRATLASPDVEAGPESQEVRLWPWEDVPWESLAFPTVAWALRHHRETQDQDILRPRANPPGDPGQAEFAEGTWPTVRR